MFAHWTTQNGYGPIYLNGYTPGSGISSANPRWLPRGHPARNAETAAGEASRPSWDLLSLYQAVFGLKAFGISPNGTNRVDPASGENRWSDQSRSGHYYLSLVRPAAYYRELLRLRRPGARSAAWPG